MELLIAACIGIFVNCISAIIITYGLYTVYRKSNCIHALITRRFDISKYAVILNILFISIDSNLQFLGAIIQIFEYIFIARWFVHDLLMIVLISLYFIRTWLIYYEYHCGEAVFSLVTIPDLEETMKKHLSWFIDNKQKWTAITLKSHFVRVTIGIIILLIIYLLIWPLLSKDTFIYGRLIIYILIIIALLYISKRQMLSINDNFHIQKELLITSILCTILLITSCILPLFQSLLIQYLLIQIYTISIISMGYISTWWVLQQINEDEKQYNTSKVIELDTKIAELIETLNDKSLSIKFMQHLMEEMLISNIFFLADIMAYKKQFIEQDKLSKMEGFECMVNTSISRLTFRRSFTHYGWAIAKTYIDNGLMQVKVISDETKKECIDKLYGMHPSDEIGNASNQIFVELHQQFDECCNEVWNALKQSYIRFNPLQNTELLVYGYIRHFKSNIPEDIIKTVIIYCL